MSSDMLVRLLRLVLLLMVGATVVIVIQSLPVVYQHYLTQPASYILQSLTPEVFWSKLTMLGLTPTFYAGYNTISILMRATIPWFIAGVIFLRRPDDLPALSFSLNIVLGSLIPFIPDGRTGVTPAFGLYGRFFVSFAQAYIFSSLYWFPDLRFVPRWTAIMPFVWLTFTLLIAFVPETSALNPNVAPSWLVYSVQFFLLASLIYSLLYRYRHEEDILKRQQTRLLFFALILALSYLIVINPVTIGRILDIYNLPDPWGILYHLFTDLLVSDLLLLFLMVTIGVSILQYRLFAIEVILRQTLIYSILTLSLLAVYGLCIIFLERTFRSITDGSSQLSIVISTLAIAALFMPLKSLLQLGIDRHFYRHRYDADRTLLSFTQTMRFAVEPERLVGGLVTAVNAAMQPEFIVFWMRKTSHKKTSMDEAWRMLLEEEDDN